MGGDLVDRALGRGPRDRNAMSRRRAIVGALPPDLYLDLDAPRVRIGRPSKHELATCRVVDDWPTAIPITEAELDLFEAHFGELIDRLFGEAQKGRVSTSR